jgi:exopolysaccharide production protein ExoZ
VSSRLHNLQALRGVACLLVVFFHIADWEANRGIVIPHPVLSPLNYCGFAGVDLFFVLSGFVITWVNAAGVGDRSRLPGYLGRRLWRIYPVYWACWVVAAAIYIYACHWSWPFDRHALPRLLLLVPTTQRNLFLPQAWTLSYELMFYAAFSLFFLLPRRAFVPMLATWFAAIVAAAAFGPILPAIIPTGWAALTALVHPFVSEFLLGCVAAVLVRRGCTVWGRTCLIAGIVGFAAGGLMQYLDIVHAHYATSRVVQFGVPSALIVYGAVAAEAARGWVLPRWLQSIGDASYPIYLIHLAVFEWAQSRVGDMSHALPGHLLWIVLLAGTAIAAGFAIHFAVERPLMHLVRRRSVRPNFVAQPVVHSRAA